MIVVLRGGGVVDGRSTYIESEQDGRDSETFLGTTNNSSMDQQHRRTL